MLELKREKVQELKWKKKTEHFVNPQCSKSVCTRCGATVKTPHLLVFVNVRKKMF